MASSWQAYVQSPPPLSPRYSPVGRDCSVPRQGRQFGVLLYWLRQLRRVLRSLDDESAVILVHAFVTSRVDYCNLLLVGASKSVTDKLQRVMNAAARVVSGTKYDRGLTHLLHSELHWLAVADRVTYKLEVMAVAALAMGLRGSSPLRFCSSPPPRFLYKVMLCLN